MSVANRVLRTKSGERRWWPLLTAVVVIAVTLSLLVPAGRHQWALSIFRQPARYTALSFNYGWELPTTAIIDSPIPISFTIGNQEGRPLTYRYVLRQSNPLNVSRTLATAAHEIRPGKTWTVSVAVRPTCRPSPCRIEVSLPRHPESIDFLVILTPGQRKHHHRTSSRAAGRRHARRT